MTNGGKYVDPPPPFSIMKPIHSPKSQKLFELIMAANYMNIKELLDLTTQRVADMIRG